MYNYGGQSQTLEPQHIPDMELIVTKLFGQDCASKSKVLSDARHCLDVGPNIFFLAQITSPGCGEVNNIRGAAKYEN